MGEESRRLTHLRILFEPVEAVVEIRRSVSGVLYCKLLSLHPIPSYRVAADEKCQFDYCDVTGHELDRGEDNNEYFLDR